MLQAAWKEVVILTGRLLPLDKCVAKDSKRERISVLLARSL